VAVSKETADKQGFLGRRVRVKWVIIAVTIAVVVMAVILVSLLLVDRHRDSERRAAATEAAAATEVTSPYDFSELPADSGLNDIEGASFVSVLLADEAGQLTGYKISSDQPAAQVLTEAIRGADELDAAALATTTADSGGASDTGDATVSNITYVFPDRSTLTFDLYLDQGLIARGDQAWRPDGDLQALVEAVVAAGQ
jgi:hypothetical protein